jgi:two-component system, response regulator
MDDKVILLIEDNPADAALTIRAFKKTDVGHQIVLVKDGVEALDFLNGTGEYAGIHANELPKVILLDLKLPRLNGIEVLERIRSNPRTRLMPVVVLTSSNEDNDIIDSYKHGANSYIRKTVDFHQFTRLAWQIADYWLNLNQTAPVPQGSHN